jgi:ParB-like chromosome segregation protein Spo0J
MTAVASEGPLLANPRHLKPHPLNDRLYNSACTPDLLASIREQGILEPLVALPDLTLISGHRRRDAAIQLDLPLVPVIVREFEDQLSAIIGFNTQRKKTWGEIYQEARLLYPRMQARAAVRRVEGAKRGAAVKHGHEVGEPPAPRQKAVDELADIIGVNRERLRKLLRLYSLVEAGQAPDEITRRLNEGKYTVHEAYRKARKAVRLEERRLATEKAVLEQRFDWSDRVICSDVWEFGSRRDHAFHNLSGDAPALLDNALGSPPADLFINLIHHFSRESDLVADPFAGRGQIHRIALAMRRRVRSFDLHPRAEFIERRDARHGPPFDLQPVNLLVLDPPYGITWKYSESSDDLCNAPNEEAWLGSLEVVIRSWRRAVAPSGFMAVVVGSEYRRGTDEMIDRAWGVGQLLDRTAVVVRRIQAPYPASHFEGARAAHAQANGWMLSRIREIYVARL